MIDIDAIAFDFIDANILVNEQRPKAVLPHQGVVFQNTHFWKTLKLIYARQDLIRKLPRIRNTDLCFIILEKLTVLIARFAQPFNLHEAVSPFLPAYP